MKLKMLFMIISLQVFWLFSENTINETAIYNALKTHVEELKSKKDFKAAIHVLDGFIKLHPLSKYLPSIFFEKGKIMLENLNIVEEGYSYIEKAESMRISDFRKEFEEIKNKYGEIVTKERIIELVFYIEKYFFIEQKFPENLDDLASYFKLTNKINLKDGFGNNINYIIKDNEFLKGEDFLTFEIFSYGKDMAEKTKDDIYYISNNAKKIDLRFIQASRIDNRWTADIEYFDEKHKVSIKKKVKEGDLIKNYIIFGIRENGIMVIKDKESYVVKKE